MIFIINQKGFLRRTLCICCEGHVALLKNKLDANHDRLRFVDLCKPTVYDPKLPLAECRGVNILYFGLSMDIQRMLFGLVRLQPSIIFKQYWDGQVQRACRDATATSNLTVQQIHATIWYLIDIFCIEHD